MGLFLSDTEHAASPTKITTANEKRVRESSPRIRTVSAGGRSSTIRKIKSPKPSQVGQFPLDL